PAASLTDDETLSACSSLVRRRAIRVRWLAPLAADRASMPPSASSLTDDETLSARSSLVRRRAIRYAWSAPGNSTTEIPRALPIAARISSAVPKLSLLPCKISLGTVGASSSASRDFSGRPGRCNGNARHTIAAGFVYDAVRQATRAPALRPPTRSECCAHSCLSSQSSAAHHASSSFGGGAPTLRPAVRQGCSNRTTVVPSAGRLSA